MKPNDTALEDVVILAVAFALIDLLLFAAAYKADINPLVAGLGVALLNLGMAWTFVRKRR